MCATDSAMYYYRTRVRIYITDVIVIQGHCVFLIKNLDTLVEKKIYTKNEMYIIYCIIIYTIKLRSLLHLQSN